MKCLDDRNIGAACISVLLAASGAVASPVYVNPTSTCVPATQTCGTTWATAYPSLQPAIDEAGLTAGTEVWVAEGKYLGPVTIPDAVKVYGGFAGSEALASQARPRVYVTRISGGSPAISTTATGTGTILRGFHIRGGSLTSLTGTPNVGAGLFLQGSSMHVIDCVFSANTSTLAGGAAGMEGAGSPVFENCVFSNNNGGLGGGAVGIRAGSPTFINCLFHDNEASEGGAVVNFDGTPTFINCTFADNTATEGSGGGLFDSVGKAVIRNSILWGNTANRPNSDQIYCGFNQVPIVTNSCVEDDEPNDGIVFAGTSNYNIDTDPGFVYAAGGNYQLTSESGCENKGDTAVLPSDVNDVDLDGDTTEKVPDSLRVARPLGVVDMGAFEDDGRSFYADFVPKNRFISIVVDNPGEPTAVRVTLLHSGQFPSSEGRQWWVSAPFTVNDDGTTRHIARLGCTPLFHDWTGISVVHIGDAEVVPDATYSIEALTLSAAETAGGSVCDQGAYEPALIIPTSAVWADVVGTRSDPALPWPPPDFVVLEDDDLAAVFDKFSGTTEPSLIWTDLDPQVPDLSVSVVDVVRAQDVVNGITAYPFGAPAACSTSGCSYGACCGATCSNTPQANCSGTWIGGEFCESSPDPCASILGACCDIVFGTCSQTTQSQCTGDWTGGANCFPDPCGGSSSSSMTGDSLVTEQIDPVVESDPYDVIPPALAELRQAARLSQKKLADQIGKSKTWVQDVENGTTRIGYTDLKAWCGACGTTLSQLIRDLAGL